jgi:hypothetical protein
MSIKDSETATGRCYCEAVGLQAGNCFTHRSGKSLLRLCESQTSTSSSRISKRTVSVRRAGTDAGSCPCCCWKPADDCVMVLSTVDEVVTLTADNRSGLWARDGESEGDGVPDVMSLHLTRIVS